MFCAPQWADKLAQATPGATGCAQADQELLPLLRREQRCVDQETLALESH